MSNTFDAALVTETLKNRAVTILQAKLVALTAFSMDFGTDELAPKKTIEVPKATAGSTTLTNPTNWEAGDNTLSKITVAVNQYAQPFHITNEQLQQGHRLENVIDINLRAFANKILDVAFTPITVANFGAKVVDVAAASFGSDDLKVLYGAIKNSDIKNLVLDSDYYAQFLPTTLEEIGPKAGLAGFTGVFENTRWTGAGANVVGFACNPQAVGVASGLPIMAPGADQEFITMETVTIPGLNITVAYYVWFSRGSRTLWASYDVMFGAGVGDTTALKLIGNSI